MTAARALAAAALGALGAGSALGACASFESPSVVLDLRVLAMTATVPDQILDVDFEHPPQPADLLAQLLPSTVCALVADPAQDRRLRWSMTLCVLDLDQRCDSANQRVLVEGVAPDPDTAVPQPALCATVEPDGNLLGILLEAIEGDTLRGLGGIDYGVSLQVAGEDDPPQAAQLAGKRLRVAPRVPPGRSANTNPRLDQIAASIEGGDPIALPAGRCVDQAAPLVLGPRQRLKLTPIEPPGVREAYVVPRLDGEAQTFTESLTYQWLTGAGGFSSGSTGGPRDVSGNPPELFTEYRAPAAKDLTGPTDIPLWVIQRDERLGAAWYEGCVRVIP